jgi:hypothetical protein
MAPRTDIHRAAAIAAVAALLSIAAPASAAVTSRSAEVTSSPNVQQLTIRGPIGVTLALDSAWDAYSPPSSYWDRVRFLPDEAFEFDMSGIPTCDPASLAGTTTAEADGACGAAKLGSGHAGVNGPSGPAGGVVSVFNGAAPSTAVLLHIRLTRR